MLTEFCELLTSLSLGPYDEHSFSLPSPLHAEVWVFCEYEIGGIKRVAAVYSGRPDGGHDTA